MTDNIEALVKEHGELSKLRNDLELMLESKLVPVKTRIAGIEHELLAHFNENGITSLKTLYGTPYKATTRSISIDDASVFFDFVAKEGAFELFQKRVNLSAYEELINAGTDVPGVKVSSFIKLKIKKS